MDWPACVEFDHAVTKVIGYLSRRSAAFLIALALLLVIALGLVDYLTGTELAFSIVYLLPVSLAAWLVGRRAGIGISMVAAVSWLLADLLGGNTYSRPAIPYWNMGVRLGFFVVVTYALSALRKAREQREEWATFIVHDLRSPLSTMITGLQTLDYLGGDSMDAKQRELVELCLRSGERMLLLINSLLDVARLEDGKMPLNLSQVDVGKLVQSSLQEVKLWAQERHVTLASEVDAAASTVCADEAVTVRILLNLLGNALKSSPAESTITVRATPFETTQVAFSVIDQGRGIPKARLSRVFDKFAQAESYGAGGAVGSGLGLTFCHLAVEAQGGRIWLESEIGQGTTVTFTLPAVPIH
jgi:signal transduction histidine kinase